jgi:hypothetical protein
MSTLTLLCYVRGDKYKQAFTVKIKEGESVADLKKAIKEEQSPIFDHVTANSLALWRVSIPCNRGLKAKVESLSLNDDHSLEPASVLSEVFSDGLKEKHVHVVVEHPGPGK